MQATPQEYQFHQRLCARGDPIAFAELAEWLYDALVMEHYKPSLDRLAQLAQERPNLLAGPLQLYKEQEGVDDQHLATMLKCELEAIPRLALCERPRPAPHFREDVERIAAYIHADMLQLAMLIRAAESREALSHRNEAVKPTLLAARDHDEDEEMEDPEGPQAPDIAASEHEPPDGLSR